MDVLREVVLPRLDAVKKTGAGFSARCPAHEDRQASLSVSEGREHPVVFHCHAGCQPEDICAKLGLDWKDLSKPGEAKRDRGEWTPYGEAVAVYRYYDEAGNLLFEVCRTADKQFPVRVPDPTAKSGYRWKLGDTRRVLYRLPQVLAAVEECRTVFVCEGEKDVHTLESHGMVGTCNPGGAGRGKWLPEFSEFLRDAVVWIVADNDPPGQAHARAIRESLLGVAADITVAEAKVGKDVTDHFTAGYTLDDLLITIPHEAQDGRTVLATDLIDFLAAADDLPEWVVPGLLERGDRLILTGFEGLGKSMLVRQLAVCAAAGRDPFHHQYDHTPARVLFIDCENSEAQSRRKLRPIAATAQWLKSPVKPGQMRLIHRAEGIDLTDEADAAWFLERVRAHEPDILFVGPFYRLHNANMNDEQVARRVVSVLDAARAINNCALVTEAHAGHGEAGKSRSVRPTGSSLLLRWPEFGYGLVPSAFDQPDANGTFRRVDVLPWRGPRDERDWPRHIEYGDKGEMPWRPWRPPPKPAKEK